jgi:predicted nucleic acid-binding protein
MAAPKILIDTNVVLDVLQARIPFYDASKRLLAAAETGRIEGMIAAHTVTTLFYLISKDKSTAQAHATITNLLQFLKVASVDQSTIEQALNLSYQDFEDAVQMISAIQSKCDFLVSRNKDDFKPALLPVISPVDMLSVL